MPFDFSPPDPTKPITAETILLRAAQIVRERWMQGELGDDGGPRCAMGAIREAAYIYIEKEKEAAARKANVESGGWYPYPKEIRKIVDQMSEAYERLDKIILDTGYVLKISKDKGPIANWNDQPGRTAEEVAQAMESAALLAK